MTFRTTVLILLTSLSAQAQIQLQPGQSVVVKDPATYSDVVVTCGGGAVPPGTQPQPTCDTQTVLSKIDALQRHAGRLAAGKCVLDYYLHHCGDRLEQHALGDTKNAFRQEYIATLRAVESLCSSRQCGWNESQAIVREFSRANDYIARTPLVYDEVHQDTMIDRADISYPYCR